MKYFFSLIFVALLFGCQKEEETQNDKDLIPSVITFPARVVTQTEADLSVQLTSSGVISCDRVPERGVCYGLHSIPTLENSQKLSLGSCMGGANGKVSGLKPNTKYYYRGYAKYKTSSGDAVEYGEIKYFVTPN